MKLPQAKYSVFLFFTMPLFNVHFNYSCHTVISMKEIKVIHYNLTGLKTRTVNCHFLVYGALLFVIFKNFWLVPIVKRTIKQI